MVLTACLALSGAACTAYFLLELSRVCTAARPSRATARDPRTGRPMTLRRDRRRGGRRQSDRTTRS